MLSEFSQHIDSGKFNEYLSRLDHVDTKTALAAECELTVLWAISRVASFVPEPAVPGSARRPDAASNDLFPSAPSLIEVRALSDDSFSGKEAMERTANIISSYADRLRKGAGRHLYYEFLDHNVWVTTTRYRRERRVDPKFRLSPKVKVALRQWIQAPNWPCPERITIEDGRTAVIISWRDSTVPWFRTFSRVPPVADDLEDNPVYKALKKKAKQLKGASPGTLRCVVLVDAGCDLLRRLRPMGGSWEVSGEDIVHHALRKLSIDSIIVLSPDSQTQLVLGMHSELFWKMHCFDSRVDIPDGDYDRVREMAAQLPKPHFEAYRARNIHRQGGFAPESRRWYLGSRLTITGGGKMTVKLSAGLLHEYLAGRINGEEFRKKAFNNEENFFEREFARGYSINGAKFEPGGIDEDDDYIVFELDLDWKKLAVNQKTPSASGENEQ